MSEYAQQTAEAFAQSREYYAELPSHRFRSSSRR